MEITNIIYWAFNGLAAGTFIVLGFLLKNVFESVKEELANLKVVMTAILDFIAHQREKNDNYTKEIDDIWDKIDGIEIKMDDAKETINKIKILHQKNHNEKI